MPKPSAKLAVCAGLAFVLLALLVAIDANPASAHGIERAWYTYGEPPGAPGVQASGRAHLLTTDSCAITGTVYDTAADGYSANVTIIAWADNGDILYFGTRRVTGGKGSSEPIAVSWGSASNLSRVSAYEWTSRGDAQIDRGDERTICNDNWWA